MAELRPIRDWPGYRAGSDGSIWSLKRGGEWKPLRAVGRSDGYRVVRLSVPGRMPRTCYVHHLILEAFYGPRPERARAGFGSGGRSDCRADNLFWKSPLPL